MSKKKKVKIEVIFNVIDNFTPIVENIVRRLKAQDTINWFLHKAVTTDDLRYYRVSARLMEISKGE